MTTFDQLPLHPAAVPLTGQQYQIGTGRYRATVTEPVRATAIHGLTRWTVAIEPMTCPPNAFVTGDDLLVLEPGQAVTHTWGIQVLDRGRCGG